MKILVLALAVVLVASFSWAQTQTATTGEDALKNYKMAEKAYADASIELQRTELRKDKRELIKAVAKFDEKQANAFWPIYDNYEKELTRLNDKRLAILKDYAANWANLTDAQATQMTAAAMDYMERRIALRKAYMEKINKVLPGILVARMMQFEHQLDLLVDLEIASQVPLAE